MHEDNTAAYHTLHGKRTSGRLAEFREHVVFWIPKARRAALDTMWAPRTFLGTTMTPNEAYVATPGGHVTRARGMPRVRPDVRWRPGIVEQITGIPDYLNGLADDSIIEGKADPHIQRDLQKCRPHIIVQCAIFTIFVIYTNWN